MCELLHLERSKVSTASSYNHKLNSGSYVLFLLLVFLYFLLPSVINVVRAKKIMVGPEGVISSRSVLHWQRLSYVVIIVSVTVKFVKLLFLS